MDRLFESQRRRHPRGWQASVLAEQNRRRGSVGNNPWLTSDAAGLFLGALGSAFLLLLLAVSLAWILAYRNYVRERRRQADELRAKHDTSLATPTDATGTTAEKECEENAEEMNAPTGSSTLRQNTPEHVATSTAANALAETGATETSASTATTALANVDPMAPAKTGRTSKSAHESAINELTTAISETTDAMGNAEIQERIQGARQTLSSIQAELPDGLTPAEKYAMTQMMLDAIKVNESCKATSSMQRMEHIAEHGNEIQSELRAIKEEKTRNEETARRALALQRNTMDGLCVGVVSMICAVAAVIWYAGSLAPAGPSPFFGTFKIRTVRTMAMSSCHTHALMRSISIPLPLSRRMLPVIMPFAQLWCYATHAVRVIQAGILLVLTPIVISKLGLFQLGSGAPVFKLVTTCGLICGASGWYAVDWLGGQGVMWLVLWEAYVAVCIAVIVSASRIVVAAPGMLSGKIQGEGLLFLATIFFGCFMGVAPFVTWGTP